MVEKGILFVSICGLIIMLVVGLTTIISNWNMYLALLSQNNVTGNWAATAFAFWIGGTVFMCWLVYAEIKGEI
jgi:hypothetical protein